LAIKVGLADNKWGRQLVCHHLLRLLMSAAERFDASPCGTAKPTDRCKRSFGGVIFKVHLPLCALSSSCLSPVLYR
jgi:hypothetical protein